MIVTQIPHYGSCTLTLKGLEYAAALFDCSHVLDRLLCLPRDVGNLFGCEKSEWFFLPVLKRWKHVLADA